MRINSKIILVASIALVSSGVAVAACKTAPDCASLGYTEEASNCSGSFLKCPWDLSKASCTTCKIANCAKCKASNPSECETCADGYSGWPLALVGQETHWTECRKSLIRTCNVANCKTCEDGTTDQCKVCNDGYVLDLLTKTCSGKLQCPIVGCMVCSSDKTKCTKCMTNYTLTSAGKCIIQSNI